MLRVRPRRPHGLPELCQPTITVKPPAGPGWLHELKYDGFRLLARRDGAGTRLFTRRGNDWTERYPLVATAIGTLKARSCVIDGEIAICDSNGLPVFDLLRHGPRVKREAVLFAFDLLELNGRDLTRDPIEARTAVLAKLLHQALPSLQIVEHLEADGAIVFQHACQIGEGVVSKRAGSRYEAGRSDKWRKTKNPNHAAVTRLLEEDWNG
jgi:bifunctional non-homologous end joining protein LigD